MKRAVLTGLSIPAAVVPVLLWALLGIFAGKDWRFESPALRWTLRPWAARLWRYTTRVLYVEIRHPSHVGNKRIERHENTHTRQMEDLSAMCFVLALTAWAGGCNPTVAGCIGIFGPWLILLNYVTAWLRGGHPYRDAEHEIAARAVAG